MTSINRSDDLPGPVPSDIIDAVKKIEEYAFQKTTRDDWAIGNITCRAGAQKLLTAHRKLLDKFDKIKMILKE